MSRYLLVVVSLLKYVGIKIQRTAKVYNKFNCFITATSV